MNIRVLTVDDEVLALRRLKLLLETMPQVDHVGEASSCADALYKTEKLAPDILLLDIKMRDGSGFDLIEALAGRARVPAIIFVSAFDRFAMQAFDASVADYLLKPVERDRLARAIDRARSQVEAADAQRRIEELGEIVRLLRSAENQAQGTRYETELWIRKGNGGLFRVFVDNIDWVSSEEDYVRLHTHAGSFLMRGSIRGLEERIDPALFVRVHRRALVRKAAIAALKPSHFGHVDVVLANGKAIRAGRVYAKKLGQLLRPAG